MKRRRTTTCTYMYNRWLEMNAREMTSVAIAQCCADAAHLIVCCTAFRYAFVAIKFLAIVICNGQYYIQCLPDFNLHDTLIWENASHFAWKRSVCGVCNGVSFCISNCKREWLYIAKLVALIEMVVFILINVHSSGLLIVVKSFVTRQSIIQRGEISLAFNKRYTKRGLPHEGRYDACRHVYISKKKIATHFSGNFTSRKDVCDVLS